MASSNATKPSVHGKNCRCGGEGDTNVWTTKASDSSEKQANYCPDCEVLKSGPLFLSSKGIGWTSWKKRWFILTRTSLVFFRSDPNSPPKGTEANTNLTLGGLDLNNSGSVIVKADKKLLTVLFPDGQDGRTFTLKAETSEELNEWKTALENALTQAPNASLVPGQDGIISSDVADPTESSAEQFIILSGMEKQPVNSLVIGRPILLALEEVDGTPSFLEKALRFIEQYGIKVEGILRQSADVDDVERRVQEYEQGRNEFSENEDAHVIGDCIKHVLRELQSSPVPASCCTDLVEAYRTDRGSRIVAIHSTISKTFPEPNRRLLQRVLRMMWIVASNKSDNRMSLSAVAACMAPLLLRPLLAGDCKIENDFNMGGDGSMQLLQAAAAANHAQAIVIILLEHYERIFDEDLSNEGSFSSEVYSDSEDDVEDEELTDDDILEDNGYDDAENDLDNDIEDDFDHSSSETRSDSDSDTDSDSDSEISSYQLDNKACEDQNGDCMSPESHAIVESPSEMPSMTNILSIQDLDRQSSLPPPEVSQQDDVQIHGNGENVSGLESPIESSELIQDSLTSVGPVTESDDHRSLSPVATSSKKSIDPMISAKKPTVWGRTSARKNLSMESIDYSCEDENTIQKLETTKSDLQAKLMKEVKGNIILQASLEKKKEGLFQRRLALQHEVEKLREQLQRERELRASLESGLMNMRPGQLLITSNVDCKTKADLEEVSIAEADIINLKHKVSVLRGQLNHQLKSSNFCESCRQLFSRCHPQSGNDENIYVENALIMRGNGVQQRNGLEALDGEHIFDPSIKPANLLPNPQHQDKPKEMATNKSDSSPPDFKSSSMNKELTSGASTSSKKLSARNENASIKRKEGKSGAHGSPSSSRMQQAQEGPHPNSNRKGLRPSISSNAMCTAPTAISLKTASKRTAPRGDHNSASASGINSGEEAEVGGHHPIAPRKSYSWGENAHKEILEQPASSFAEHVMRLSSGGENPSGSITSGIAFEDSAPRDEQHRASSSASNTSASSTFNKLAIRLNFFKDLQNLETSRGLGRQGPPPR